MGTAADGRGEEPGLGHRPVRRQGSREGAVKLAAPACWHVRATSRALPQQGAQPGTTGAAAGTHQQAAGEAPQAMHRPGTGPEPLQLGQQRVLEQATGGQHRQAAGLVEHQQVAVVEQRGALGQHRHGGLLPGGPMPLQPIADTERPIGPELLAVPPDLAGHQPLAPHRPIRVAVAGGIEAAHPQRAIHRSGRQVLRPHPVAIGVALVQGRRQPPRGQGVRGVGQPAQSTRPCSRA